MSDDGVGKKAGAAGLGLAAILAALGRNVDNCGGAGLRAGGSVADDVARGAGRVPGAIADDVAFGAGRARLGGMADDVARAPGRVPIAGVGVADDGVLALADDAARAGSGPHKTLEEALVEAGVDIALELVPLGPEESPAVEDAVRMPRPVGSLSINASYSGRPGVIALVRTPALESVSTKLQVTVSSSTDAAGLLERTRSKSRLRTPLTILGRSDHDRDALVLPTGAPVRIVDILRGCEEESAPCLVMACEPLAPPECDDAIASIWKSAAESLPGVSGGSGSAAPTTEARRKSPPDEDAVFADPRRARVQLTRGLHEGRAADARANGSFVARLQRSAEGWSMVIASGR